MALKTLQCIVLILGFLFSLLIWFRNGYHKVLLNAFYITRCVRGKQKLVFTDYPHHFFVYVVKRTMLNVFNLSSTDDIDISKCILCQKSKREYLSKGVKGKANLLNAARILHDDERSERIKRVENEDFKYHANVVLFYLYQ